MKRFVIAAHALQALTILAAMYVVFVPILIIVAVTLNFDEIDIGIAVVRVGESTTWWHAILSFIPNAIVAFGLLNLTRFGNFIAQGIRFTKSVTSCLQRASILYNNAVISRSLPRATAKSRPTFNHQYCFQPCRNVAQRGKSYRR